MVQRSIDTLTIDGGWLSLDFINTISDRFVKEPFDYLSSYPFYMDWAHKLELLEVHHVNHLKKLAKKDGVMAAKSWIQAIEVRELLYRIFLNTVKKQPIEKTDQKSFNKWLTRALNKQAITFTKLPELCWDISTNDLSAPLYSIIKSASDLLLSDKLERVKECSACGWLFLDQSKNKSRRWCRMETCGSQSKARHYYQRNKTD